MSQPLSIDPKTSALLLMDFQGFVLDNFLTPAAAAEVVGNASKLLRASRAVDMLTIHVTVAFRPGYPEISPGNKLFTYLKESGLVTPGSGGTEIHKDLTPLELEPVVAKHRIGAFTGTDLERLLRANGIETLVLAGVTTTGVVLSTVRQAFDLDYQMVIASDGCTDPDEQTHVVLIEKVISQHAAVQLTADIEAALKS
ncbi:isochorismatase family cysteine hydrolase [Paraburkholderia largidicola]|uniref:Isochorismatase n=1 Tax=Paraburkholderia largidicola TaxID=3014751 RepID=A0A7I8BLQ9_9BURK|nr:isochorismatase family cysteine hydrolase [Paraburkholderia sp. PGU16]BCF89070.1 isochorismatase [Paraburkholderia sp. PGU16]